VFWTIIHVRDDARGGGAWALVEEAKKKDNSFARNVLEENNYF